MANTEKIKTGASSAPVLFLDTDTKSIQSENNDICKELADKVLGGLLKIARAFVPSRETLDGTKEQCDVALQDNIIYINTDTASYLAMISVKLDGMCKKRGPLKPAIAQMMSSVCADLNYGILNPWIKLHAKNIRSAYIGPEGFKFVVSKDIVELNVPPTIRSTNYANTVIETLDKMVPPHVQPSFGPFDVDFSKAPDDVDAFVIHIMETEVVFGKRLKIETGYPQLKIRRSMIKDDLVNISAYPDALTNGYIVRLYSDTATYVADQYFRVLPL